MKKTLLFFAIILMASQSDAQGLLTGRRSGEKLSREERKALRLSEEQKKVQEISQIVADTVFVLEADRVVTPGGSSMIVEPSLNFLGIVKQEAVFQTGSNNGMGLNGVGGRTLTGRVNSLEILPSGKKGYKQVNAMITTDVGFLRFEIKISPTGNASAQIIGMNGSSINYRGRIVPLAKSVVYEGVSF